MKFLFSIIHLPLVFPLTFCPPFTSRHRAFRSVEVQDGYPVTALSHSPSGDRFVVGTGSAQLKIYDREGVELLKTVKGDMYLRDLSNTKVQRMNHLSTLLFFGIVLYCHESKNLSLFLSVCLSLSLHLCVG